MQEIKQLFDYIKSSFNNYESITQYENELTIKFYKDFEIKIVIQNYYMIYVNDYFYYDVDEQDITETINDFLLGKNAFCLKNNKIKVIQLNDYKSNNSFTQVWTIDKKIK